MSCNHTDLVGVEGRPPQDPTAWQHDTRQPLPVHLLQVVAGEKCHSSCSKARSH